MKKGILLIAAGHANYYKMAEILAASIVSNDPDLPIAIVCDNPDRVSNCLFKKIIPLRKKYTAKSLLQAKTFIYQLSPFDETIFLDVDMVMLPGRKLSTLFDELKDVNFTIANTGPAEKGTLWCKLDEVHAVYGEAPFYNCHSEFIYFKKCDVVKAYFKKVQYLFEKPGISATVFAGGVADELAFQLASMVTGIYPHMDNFLPSFWWAIDRKKQSLFTYQLPTTYYFYSIGGNNLPMNVQNNYNNLASLYSEKYGLQSFKAVEKKRFLPERKNL